MNQLETCNLMMMMVMQQPRIAAVADGF